MIPTTLSRHRSLAILLLVGSWMLVALPSASGAEAARLMHLPGLGSYEVLSLDPPQQTRFGGRLFREGSRQGLNRDGLIGLFTAVTAERLDPRRMFTGARYEYQQLTSRRGKAFYSTEKGDVSTLMLSANYLGEWAEWAVTVPVSRWSLTAPRSFGPLSVGADEGVGNMKLAWKASYLPDRSYYRFAYGAVAEVTTGNPERMLPSGARESDELTLFGCVTTKETDAAVFNMQLGATLNSEGEDHRFLYRLGLTYEATAHATLIGELAGEVQGGDDHDTLDLIAGIRLAPAEHVVLEFAWTQNLRTYRQYGFDRRLQCGTTIRW
jgi:hypothetical protein